MMDPLWQQILTKYFLQSGLSFAMIGAAAARLAASILVDSAELLIADELCRGTGARAGGWEALEMTRELVSRSVGVDLMAESKRMASRHG